MRVPARAHRRGSLLPEAKQDSDNNPSASGEVSYRHHSPLQERSPERDSFSPEARTPLSAGKANGLGGELLQPPFYNVVLSLLRK